MAQTILIKRSTSTATPTALSNGELAYSADSDKLFIGRPGGGSGDIDAIGGKYYTDIITAATAANTASKLVLRDSSGNFSAGTITAALTGNASTATAWQTSRNLSLTGDGTATLSAVDGTAAVSAALTLATVNSNVGSFGSTTAIPVLTVNAKGLVTAASTVALATTLNITGDTGSDGIALLSETLDLEGGTGVTTVASANKVTFSIGQPVATTDNVTFNNVTVNGVLNSDDITATTMTASGHVVVQGNLTVNGTTTTVNSNTVAIGDSIMVLNNDEAGTPSENAGIEIERGTSTNVSLLWNEGTDYWQINDGSTTSKIMTAGNFAASFTGILDGGTF
mgnify:CR=1 FL=1|jgi:hypothetical protein